LATQPPNTDAQGCSYALKVAPGTYSVKIFRSNSVNTDQVSNPSSSVVVTAGGSVAVPFQYDYAAKFNLTYASNYTGVPAPKLPTNLDTTYLSTYSAYVDSGLKSQISLHPFTSGYAGIAGAFKAASTSGPGCVNVDPAAWPAQGTTLAEGVRSDPVAAAPQAVAAMGIPMGVAAVNFTINDYYLTAVSASGGNGDPGCSVAMTYAFGQVLTLGTTYIALPYGSWTLYSSSSANGTKTPIASNRVTPVTLGYSSGIVLTLDPRVAP
ncbi:MAG: hypothetical protein Q8M65_03535, partial [Rhodoglobus sp.]|nr:hypothetical protein [Rhodoglobus sp.]